MHNVFKFYILKKAVSKVVRFKNLETKRNEGMHLKLKLKDAHYCFLKFLN